MPCRAPVRKPKAPTCADTDSAHACHNRHQLRHRRIGKCIRIVHASKTVASPTPKLVDKCTIGGEYLAAVVTVIEYCDPVTIRRVGSRNRPTELPLSGTPRPKHKVKVPIGMENLDAVVGEVCCDNSSTIGGVRNRILPVIRTGTNFKRSKLAIKRSVGMKQFNCSDDVKFVELKIGT